MKQRTNTKRIKSQPNMVLWVALISLAMLVLCVLVVGGILAAPVLLGMYGYSQGIGVTTDTPAAVSTSGATHSDGDWLVATEVSPIDGVVTNTLGVESSEEIIWSGLPVRPLLVVRCSEGTLNAIVDTKTYLGLDDVTPSVRYRFDSDEAQRATMEISTDGSALFFQNGLDFVNEAVNHETFAIEFTPYQEGEKTAVFNIAGLYERLTPLLDTCEIDN